MFENLTIKQILKISTAVLIIRFLLTIQSYTYVMINFPRSIMVLHFVERGVARFWTRGRLNTLTFSKRRGMTGKCCTIVPDSRARARR